MFWLKAGVQSQPFAFKVWWLLFSSTCVPLTILLSGSRNRNTYAYVRDAWPSHVCLWCRKGSPPCKWMLSLLRLWLHLPSPSYIGSPLFFCFVLFGWLNIQLSVVLILTSNSSIYWFSQYAAPFLGVYACPFTQTLKAEDGRVKWVVFKYIGVGLYIFANTVRLPFKCDSAWTCFLDASLI